MNYSHEAIVWDVRDKASDNPSSTLGTFQDMDDALEAIKQYLRTDNGRWVYRVEVIDIARGG